MRPARRISSAICVENVSGFLVGFLLLANWLLDRSLYLVKGMSARDVPVNHLNDVEAVLRIYEDRNGCLWGG